METAWSSAWSDRCLIITSALGVRLFNLFKAKEPGDVSRLWAMPTQGGVHGCFIPQGTCPLLLCPGQVDGPCDPRQQPSQAEAAIMKGCGVGG